MKVRSTGGIEAVVGWGLCKVALHYSRFPTIHLQSHSAKGESRNRVKLSGGVEDAEV